MSTEKPAPSSRFKKYLKGLGWGAFLFFLIKGLIWIAVLLGVGKLFD